MTQTEPIPPNSPPDLPPKSEWINWKLRLMPLCWGGSFVAGRAAVQAADPLNVAFCRYGIATLLLLLLTWRVEGGLPALKSRQIPGILLLGLTGVFGYNLLFFLALEQVSASRAALVITTNPAFIALGAAWLYRERLSWQKLLGIGAALAGAAIVISRGDWALIWSGGVTLGDLYLLGGIATWTAYSLLGKAVMRSLSPLAATTYACLVGTPLLLIPALGANLITALPQFSLAAWGSTLYLAILGTVLPFWWYYEGMQAIGAAKAAIYITFVPVVAVLLAALLLGEVLTGAIAVGGLLVVAGILLVNRG
ncbi:MAG: DMT family transporter [Cyanobacteria bacterium P01_G01_bin.54]